MEHFAHLTIPHYDAKPTFGELTTLIHRVRKRDSEEAGPVRLFDGVSTGSNG
jgi:hypothetical protein